MLVISVLLCTHSPCIESRYLPWKTAFLFGSPGVWAPGDKTKQWIYNKWLMQLPWEWPRDRNQYDTKHSAIDSHPWQNALVSSHRKKWIIGLCEPPSFWFTIGSLQHYKRAIVLQEGEVMNELLKLVRQVKGKSQRLLLLTHLDTTH